MRMRLIDSWRTGLTRRLTSARRFFLTAVGLAIVSLCTLSVHRRNAAALIAYDRVSPGDDGDCTDGPVASEIPNWSGDVPLRVAFMQQRRAAEAAPSADMATRPPERIIRDPDPAYSAVAVDPNHNEVVLTDENLFSILVYDRATNTRATSVSDPKRIIGGLNTKIEFQCGLYIDPGSGDIYAVNNDTVDSLVVFSRSAIGDVAPDRELHTPHGTFGIAVDEEARELFLSVQHDNALVVYKKMAKELEAPLRVVQGSHTGLADPHGLALDQKRKLLFVANHGSWHEVTPPAPGQVILGTVYPGFPLSRDNTIPGSGKLLPPSISVYAKDAKGDAAPLRVIQGPKTQMDWPTGLSIDPEKNELFVANDGGGSILVFDAAASGDVAPLRVIKGPKSLVSNPTGVYFDPKNNELWSANFGNHTSTVYKPDANGDAPPIRIIRSAVASDAVPGMGNPHPIAYDTKREEILVPNCVAHPQISVFARLARGGAKPVRKVEGQGSLLGRTMHGIVYDAIRDEFTVPQQFAQAILTYRGAANGEERPVRIIQGPHTELDAPEHLEVDTVHNEIFVPTRDAGVLVFPRGADGDVAPLREIKGPDTMLSGDNVLVVDPVHNLLLVGGTAGHGQTRLLIFNRTDSGNVKPKAVIGGSNSHLNAFGGPLAVYPPKGEIIVSVRGTGPFAELSSDEAYVGIWSINDNGDVPPKWTIGGPKGVLRMPRGIALDVKNQNMMVSDKRLNAVLTFHFPELFQ
jgi:DNA-binding beta-propeller fold protein YncE